MQRLHEKDLSGHILAQGGYEHLKIPALAESKTCIDFGSVHRTRLPGDILHPEREGAEEMERTRTALGIRLPGSISKSRPRRIGMIKKHWVLRYRTPPANPIRISVLGHRLKRSY